MNFKKYNVYNNAKYCYIISGILLLAGLIVGIIIGMNKSILISGLSYLYTVLAVMILCVLVTIYFSIRREFYMAFTTVLAIIHNVCLMTALATIIRIPVDETFLMAILIVCILTIVNSMILFSGISKTDRVAEDRELMVNNKVKDKLGILVLINSLVFVMCLLMILSFDANIISLIRPLLVGVIVSFYSAVFMCMPFWGHFVKEKKKKKVEVVLEKDIDYVK